MYASVATKLPLATFAQMLHIHPLHFAQVYFKPADSDTPRSSCATVLPQYGWQDADAVSRDEIAQAIRDAEEALEMEVGFRLLPDWEVNEWHPTSPGPKPELFNVLSQDIRGFPQAAKANYGHLITGGIRAATLVDDAVAITYSDTDTDGYDETATITVAVASGQDPGEIRLFYPGKAAAPEWEIKPITVSISGLVATIVCRRENLVKEELQEALEITEVEGDVNANFLTTVDVYRIHNDPSTMATLMWHGFMNSCGCGSASCSVCQYDVQTACLNIRGAPEDAFFSYAPATWSEADQAYESASLLNGRQPDIVRLYYQSGWMDKRMTRPQAVMDRRFQRAVAVYAASMLDRPPCACSTGEWQKWNQDLGFAGGAEELATYNLSRRDLEGCPFGTRRGAIEAWRIIRRDGIALARVAVPQ